MHEFIRSGYEPGPSTPQALMDILKTDLAKWQRVVREAKISAG